MINRVLIVGFGSIGKRHLRVIRQCNPEADIRILRHQPSADYPELSNGHFSDPDSALRFRPQLAVVASPAPFHIQIAERLISIGTHVLIEKPLSHDCIGVETLIKNAAQAGCILQVGYNLRFLPSLIKFRQIIQSDEIGTVLSVRCEAGQYLPSWRPGSDYRMGVSANKALGGGALLELSHELDYMRWIFGEATCINCYLGKHSALELNVEDIAHLTLLYQRKDRHGPIANVSLDLFRHDSTRTCTAIGELGTLRWNGVEGTIEKFTASNMNWELIHQLTHQKDDSYRNQWLHFTNCVLSQQTPLVTATDGFEVLKLISAGRTLAATN